MNSDLNIDLLRAFIAVAETRHFTRAAERLNRGQSAVSMQIKRLEKAVGQKLLIRNRRHVTPTVEGEKLLGYAHRMVQLNAEALSSFGRDSVAGLVRLGATDTSVSYLPPVLAAFAERYPLIELELSCSRSWEALDSFEARDVDIALVSQPCGRDTGVQVRSEPLCWAVSARSNIADQDPLPLAIFAPGCVYRDAALEALDACGRSYRLAYHSPNWGGLDAAVSAGLAVTVLPESALTPMLRPLGLDDGMPPLPPIEILLFARQSGQSDAVAALENIVIETLDIATMPTLTTANRAASRP